MDSPQAPAVEILRCPSCGGAVPLGDGDSVRCAFCGANVPLPPAHRALRDAQRADAATRGRAQASLARLASPPGLLFRMLGSAWLSWASILLGPFFLIGAMLAGFGLVRVAEWTQREIFAELHPKKWVDLIEAIVSSALLALFVLLGSLGQRYARGREKLRATLAAKPPERPGGPALCRECGAPLLVPSGALGVHCTYCRADNLIVPVRGAAEGQGADQRKVRRAMVEAAQEARSDRSRVVWSIVLRLLLLSLVVPCFLIGPLKEEGDLSDEMPFQRGVARDQRETLVSSAKDAPCGTSDGGRFAQLALRRGAHVHASRIAEGSAPLEVKVAARRPGHGDSWRVPRGPPIPWSPGATFDYVAPHTGWFALCVEGPTPTRVELIVSSQ